MIDNMVFFEPLHTLARMLKSRKLSATALAAASLSRIEQLNPKVHAFSTVTADRALREAAQVDKELDAKLYRGPLHGIPYAVQDLFAVIGCPANLGTHRSAREISTVDASVVKVMQQAGGVLLGKCVTGDLTTDTGASEQCRTPWNLNEQTRGPAAAVAAGLVCCALGVETFGFTNASAVNCGITSLRPTFGRISRAGSAPLSWTMDKVSLLCRNVKDAATLFALLQGKDPADPATVAGTFKPTLTRSKEHIAGKHIGVVQEDGAGQEAAQALHDAAEVFASMGAVIERAVLPDHPYEALVTTIVAAETAAAFEQLLRGDGEPESARSPWHGVVTGAHEIRAVDYLRCQRLRSRMAGDFAQMFQRYDIILGPGTVHVAAAAPPESPGYVNGLESAGNLLGLPAVALPCGFSTSRSPLGMTLIGRTFAEAEILEAAHLFQSLTDWHMRRPKM